MVISERTAEEIKDSRKRRRAYHRLRTGLEKAVKKFTREGRGRPIVSFAELLIYWADGVKETKTKQLILITGNAH